MGALTHRIAFFGRSYDTLLPTAGRDMAKSRSAYELHRQASKASLPEARLGLAQSTATAKEVTEHFTRPFSCPQRPLHSWGCCYYLRRESEENHLILQHSEKETGTKRSLALKMEDTLSRRSSWCPEFPGKLEKPSTAHYFNTLTKKIINMIRSYPTVSPAYFSNANPLQKNE